MEPRTIVSDETQRISLVGLDILVRFGARDTGGALSLLEQHVPEGVGSPLHTIREDKLLLVTAGQLSLQLGSQKHRLEPGDRATIPGGTPHRFWNEGAAEARLLMLILPGGHELYLSEAARLEARQELTGPALQQLLETYGVSILERSE